MRSERLCGQLGIPPGEVMSTLCRDVKLNVSPAYLKPGFAFGGSCLPKDLRALTYRASRMDLKLPLLESVMPSNERHLERAIRGALALPGERLGIFGLAFKENTDDLRESPVVTLIEHLLGKGRDLRVYDPHIVIDQIYGSNKNYVLNAVPHIGKLMAESLEAVLGCCESLVVTQKPSPEVAAKIAGSGHAGVGCCVAVTGDRLKLVTRRYNEVTSSADVRNRGFSYNIAGIR